MHLRPFLALLAACAVCPEARADKIHKMDGSTLSDVTIVAERLGGVEYKDANRRDAKVPADEVLAVEYASKPQLVDQADTAIRDEAYPDARDDLQSFLDQEMPRKFPWSRGYALYRLIEVNEVLGELDEVAKVADRLAKEEPDSRYLPMALLKKAQALADSGQAPKATEALLELKGAIDAHSLGQLWQLEHELAAASFDANLKGEARIKRFKDIAARAGSLTAVRNRANAALGESLLLAGKPDEAEKVFRPIVQDPKGDSRTLASAYSGLGDCLYLQGEGRASTAEGKKQLEEALVHYMRVVVMHKNQVAYVPRAMFYAGRCLQLAATDAEPDVVDEANGRADKLYVKLIRNFPSSRWASEARGFRPK